MKIKVDVKEIDKGYRRILESLKEYDKAFITVGVHEGAGTYPNTDLYIGSVAFWNEFGTEKAPARPFMRRAFTEKENEIYDYRDKFYSMVLRGTITVRKALDRWGLRVGSYIQSSIKHAKDWADPLAESTVMAKSRGSERRGIREGDDIATKILIASGLMLRSIGWKSTVLGQESPIQNVK